MRDKKFAAYVTVPGELARDEPVIAEELARESVDRALSNLRGRRGGRYEPTADIEYRGWFETAEDAIHDTKSYGATRRGRYVRPKR